MSSCSYEVMMLAMLKFELAPSICFEYELCCCWKYVASYWTDGIALWKPSGWGDALGWRTSSSNICLNWNRLSSVMSFMSSSCINSLAISACWSFSWGEWCLWGWWTPPSCSVWLSIWPMKRYSWKFWLWSSFLAFESFYIEFASWISCSFWLSGTCFSSSSSPTAVSDSRLLIPFPAAKSDYECVVNDSSRPASAWLWPWSFFV